MKILLLNQAFYPDKVSTSQHLTDLALALTVRGHQVSVLTGNHGYDDPHLKFSSFERYGDVSIYRIPFSSLGKKSRWTRAVDFASFQLSLFFRLLFFPRQDRVVALTSPPLIAMLGALFCRVKGGKLIYWVMDMNPDEAIAAGWLNEKSWLARFLIFLAKKTLEYSHRIIALDRFAKERLVTRYGIRPSKIQVLPPWAHDEHLKPVPRESDLFRQSQGLGNCFVVMYSGNHSPCHPLQALLDAALHYQKDPGILFLFVGGGSGVYQVTEFKEKNKLNNIRQLPYQPLDQLSQSLSAADLHVTVMGDAFVGILHPCKIYGILSVGRPFVFVGPKESPMGDLIQESGLGDHVATGDSQSLVLAIEKIRRMTAPEKEAVCQKSLGFKNRYFGQKDLAGRLVGAIEND